MEFTESILPFNKQTYRNGKIDLVTEPCEVKFPYALKLPADGNIVANRNVPISHASHNDDNSSVSAEENEGHDVEWHDDYTSILNPQKIEKNRMRWAFLDVLKTNIEKRRHTEDELEEGCVGAYSTPAAISILSVTIRFPLTLKRFLAIIFSYIPIVLFLGMFLYALLERSMLAISMTLLLAFSSLISETALKVIYHEPRPPTSLVNSFGMPSSHCVATYSLVSYLALQYYFDLAEKSMYNYIYLFYMLLSIPVPLARFHTGDHSLRQCMVGCVYGLCFGIFWFFLTYLYGTTFSMNATV